MKPVIIFRHSPTVEPGHFATFLDRNSVPWTLVCVDQGEDIPTSASPYSGLCFMGGTMSVNDELPWIDSALTLIRDAVDQNIPIIGHCLGGQLMSKALGGKIGLNPVKEIGWMPIELENSPVAQHWLGARATAAASTHVFQWHKETFTLPKGATRLFSGSNCQNQIFALGPHLGMQCHVEMTPEMIETWVQRWEDEVSHLSAVPPSIQTPEEMTRMIGDKLPPMRALAEQLYSVWLEGLVR